MQTKYKHTSKLCTKKTDTIIELFFEFAQLKNLYRQGWLQTKIKKEDCESVADHSFTVALLGYIIAKEYRKDLDASKVMQLALFHEIGEIYVGDITPRDKVDKKEKSKKEYKAVQKVFSKIPNGKKYIAIWKEFEDKITPESQFVTQIDKFELALQASLYEKIGYQDLEIFFSYVKKRLKEPKLKSIFNELLKIR